MSCFIGGIVTGVFI